MPSISQALSRKLRQTLKKCGPFNDYQALRRIFIVHSLIEWRDDLPSKPDPKGQMNALIDLLIEEDTLDGENALVVFVRELRESYFEGGGCFQQLQELEAELRKELTPLSSTPVTAHKQITLERNNFSNTGDLTTLLEEKLLSEDIDAAFELCLKILHSTNYAPEYQLKLGDILHRQSKYNDAIRTFRRLLIEISHNSDYGDLRAHVFMMLGRTYLNVDRYDLAYDAWQSGFDWFGIEFRKAETASIKNAEYHLELPEIFYNRKSNIHQQLNIIAWGLRHAGLAYIRQDKPLPAIACWALAKDLWFRLSDQHNVAAMLSNIAAAYEDYSLSLPKAISCVTEAKQVLEQTKVTSEALLRVYNNEAYYQYCLGEYFEALKTINQALTNAGSFLSVKSELLDNQGNIYTAIGAWEQALKAFNSAIDICEAIGDTYAKILSMINKAYLYLSWSRDLGKNSTQMSLEKHRNARKLFELCFQYIREWEVESKEKFPGKKLAFAKIGIAEVFLSNDELDSAKNELQAIKNLTQDNRTPHFVRGLIWRLWGLILWRDNEFLEAKEKLQIAQNIFKEEPEKYGKSEYETWVLEDAEKLEEVINRLEELQVLPSAETVNVHNQKKLLLVDTVDKLFNTSELQTLCFELHVDFEQLEGTVRRIKVISLVKYMERHGRLEELINKIEQLRSNQVLR